MKARRRSHRRRPGFGGGLLPANQMAWEAECLVVAGLEPWETLGAAVWMGGELLREPTVGRLVSGGPAISFSCTAIR